MAAGGAGGLTGQPVPDNSGILFFELPSLASGQAVLDASLRVTLFAAQNLSPNENVDLYALGYVRELPPEHNIDSSWYYSGERLEQLESISEERSRVPQRSNPTAC